MEHTLEKMEHINWSDFQKIDIRVGTIIDVDDFQSETSNNTKMKP